jgi:hypothetical protein
VTHPLAFPSWLSSQRFLARILNGQQDSIGVSCPSHPAVICQAIFVPPGSLETWLLTGHIQSNPAPRKPAAHYCTELHRATTPNAEKRESPLVNPVQIRCRCAEQRTVQEG